MRRSSRLTIPLASAWLLLGAGCRERGASWDCTCSFLTDYDDPSTHDVRVCSSKPDHVEAEARGCAQAGAPAPVQGCTCHRASESEGCVVGACETRAD